MGEAGPSALESQLQAWSDNCKCAIPDKGVPVDQGGGCDKGEVDGSEEGEKEGQGGVRRDDAVPSLEEGWRKKGQ